MKRFIALTIGLIGLLLFTGCARGTHGDDADRPYNIPATPYVTETPNHRTIEELGATIVAAGRFWENWWDKSGVFAHTDGTSIFVPTGDSGSGVTYAPFLPSSGFTSIDDVRNHLLQFYTEGMVDAEMGSIFIEQDGRVYFADGRAGFPRFGWASATHELLEQSGSHAVVETFLKYGYFELVPGGLTALRFHMYDGRIDRIEGGSIVHATLDVHLQEDEPWNVFSVHFGNATLFIAPAYESLLAAFEYIHEMDYYEVRGAAQGDRLAIWSSVPLRDFALINISNDYADGKTFFIPISTHGLVESLLPGQAFVVNNYIGMGTLPWSGVTFTDENGERHYFAFGHDNSDSLNRFLIVPIEVR